jgi:soluble lytic murein transglycosylase-like protein
MKSDELQLASLVMDYARSYGINPGIALAQLKRESANFRADVVYGPFVGGAGERGLSQFTPGTWARFGQGPHTSAYDPDLALTAWGDYMSMLLARYSYDYVKALQGYNGGEGHVDRGNVSSGARRYASEIMAAAGSQAIPDPGTAVNLPGTGLGEISTMALVIAVFGGIVALGLLSDD